MTNPIIKGKYFFSITNCKVMYKKDFGKVKFFILSLYGMNSSNCILRDSRLEKVQRNRQNQ